MKSTSYLTLAIIEPPRPIAVLARAARREVRYV